MQLLTLYFSPQMQYNQEPLFQHLVLVIFPFFFSTLAVQTVSQSTIWIWLIILIRTQVWLVCFTLVKIEWFIHLKLIKILNGVVIP